uniref:Uncharacterized protein n=1 Tax=Anguilla anguilla TaxID=7936 RepID=A0A0E9XHL2_ANGAN
MYLLVHSSIHIHESIADFVPVTPGLGSTGRCGRAVAVESGLLNQSQSVSSSVPPLEQGCCALL